MLTVTLRVTFANEHAARGLWHELHERAYQAELVVRATGEAWFVVVTTDPAFRAEIEGLAWMAGGHAQEVTRRADIAGERLIG